MTWVQYDIPPEIWSEFKKIVTKDMTLEQAVISLIKRAVDENKSQL